ncbi:glycosyltransferase family 39 protein [Vagococcus acidifermentans]|nr:glycosyltransferase family 39 protein [Vagococcus acidifermentans]
MIVSKNSPLYILNNWVDLNAFLTMGKGWAHGLIPYKDLFEQKGPALFFIFRIAACLSNSYFGVFLVEIVFFFVTLVLIFKIARFFLDIKSSLIMCFISTVFLTMGPYFSNGGSAEELAFPAIFYTLYLIFKFQHYGFRLNPPSYILAGVSLGYLFWSKYTMIGSWIGFFVALAICLLILKDLKQLIQAVVYSLFGFSAINFLVFAYFYVNQALNDLYFAYFYSNIKLYPTAQLPTVLSKLVNAVMIFVAQFKDKPLLLVFLIIGIFVTLFDKKIFQSNYTVFLYLSAYFLLILTTFYGGKTFIYYYLILMPFACVPILSLFVRINQDHMSFLRLGLLSLACAVLSMGMNGNISYSKIFPQNAGVSLNNTDSEPAQVRFAKIIRQEKNPTLLNYGHLDMGLYQAADILPINYFFHRVNIPHNHLPEMMDEQNRVVNKKQVMFVVCRTPYGKKEEDIPKNIRDNYELVAKQDQYSGMDLTFWLYKVKGQSTP